MTVPRRVAPITVDALADLPQPCRSCVFWELDPVLGARATAAGEGAEAKAAWVSSTLLEWGSCGRVVSVDERLAGYALYAPPSLLPRSSAFPTAPPAPDAVLLATLTVLPEFAGGGLGRLLVQSVVKDLASRGVRALEAYGSMGPEPAPCLMPAGFLLAVGFTTVRPHPRTPRLRLDVRGTVSWRADVEGALERLIGSIQPMPVGARRIGS